MLCNIVLYNIIVCYIIVHYIITATQQLDRLTSSAGFVKGVELFSDVRTWHIDLCYQAMHIAKTSRTGKVPENTHPPLWPAPFSLLRCQLKTGCTELCRAQLRKEGYRGLPRAACFPPHAGVGFPQAESRAQECLQLELAAGGQEKTLTGSYRHH